MPDSSGFGCNSNSYLSKVTGRDACECGRGKRGRGRGCEILIPG